MHINLKHPKQQCNRLALLATTIISGMCTFKSLAYLAAFCQVIGYAVSQQPSLVSFGDFMEFDVALHKACENVSGGESNTTWPIIKSFTQCTYDISQTKPRDNFQGLESICRNKGKYFECWDKMKSEALAKCGSNKESQLPAVYRATVTALCGNDNGARIVDNLKKALAEVRPDDEQNCPEETGIHWIENCKDLLDTMNSSDLCARHGAIDKCLQKITCDNIKFGRLMRQIYTDGRPHLQCNERRA